MENKNKYPRNNLQITLSLRLIKIQRQASNWLNARCSGLSPKALMAILIVFCSLCSSILIMLIMGKL